MEAPLRIARLSNNLEALLPCYQKDLGFEIIGSFTNHEGFDGLMLGHPGWQYQLEFTKKLSHPETQAPTAENLLVFYLPDHADWMIAIERMRDCGFAPVSSLNPCWDVRGVTSEDPDG